MVRKTTYALIFWIPATKTGHGHRSVVRKTLLPRHVEIGAVVSLNWIFDDGSSKKLPVKVIDFGTSEKALDEILLDSKGNVISNDRKAYPSCVVALKRDFEAQKRKLTQAQGKADNAFHQSMISKPSMFSVSTILGIQRSASTSSAQPKKHEGSPTTPIAQMISGATSADDPEAQDVPIECETNDSSAASSAETTSVQGSTAGSQHFIDEGGKIWSQNFFKEDYLLEMRDLFINHASVDVIAFVRKLSDIIELRSCKSIDLEELKFILSQLKKMCSSLKPPKLFKLSNDYLVGGNDKEEVHPGCGFFLSKIQMELIRARAGRPQPKWRRFNALVLAEVYQENLMWISACGTGATLGINGNLYSGLYSYATQEDFTVNTLNFNKHISSIANNERNKVENKLLGHITAKRKKLSDEEPVTKKKIISLTNMTTMDQVGKVGENNEQQVGAQGKENLSGTTVEVVQDSLDPIQDNIYQIGNAGENNKQQETKTYVNGESGIPLGHCSVLSELSVANNIPSPIPIRTSGDSIFPESYQTETGSPSYHQLGVKSAVDRMPCGPMKDANQVSKWAEQNLSPDKRQQLFHILSASKGSQQLNPSYNSSPWNASTNNNGCQQFESINIDESSSVSQKFSQYLNYMNMGGL